MIRHSSTLALSAGLAIGLLVLLAGLVAGRAMLAEWQWPDPPERQEIERTFRSVAEALEVELGEAPPRTALATPPQEVERARRLLGEEAREWLVSERVPVTVTVTQKALWAGRAGRLGVELGPRGEVWSVTWSPISLRELFGVGGQVIGALDEICGPLVRPGEALGEPHAAPSLGQGVPVVLPLEGAVAPFPQHLVQLDLPGATVLCQRRPGNAAAGVGEAEAELEAITEALFKWLGMAAGFVVVGGLFVWMAVRQRLDIVHGSVLGGGFAVSALASLENTGPEAVFLAITVLGKAFWIFVLWSVAESMVRSMTPGFTTSLDTLRRARLGRRAGLALVYGVALGAALAGARVGWMALAEPLSGVRPAGLTVAAPLFASGSNPIAAGAIWCGLALLAFALARNLLPPAWAILVASLVAGAAVSPVALRPWPAQALAGIVLTLALLAALRRFGLTTALVGAILAFSLPSGLWAFWAPGWTAGTWAGGLALVSIPLIAGFVGLASARDDSAREAAPSFVRRLERERRLAYEMELLARMQTGLLPRSLPSVPGYELTARSLLATEAGGDLYDFLRDERGRLWIACGDVAGHGYSCAIAQATVKAALVSLVDGERSPAEILSRVDRVLRVTLSEQQFVTLSLLRLTPETGELLVANAAHPFPMLWRGGAVTELDLPGLPLGQGPERRYRDHRLELAPGEVVVVYSDGLAEAMSPEGQEYGFDRPQSALASAAHWNAAEVLERLLWDWRHHLAGRAPMDDTTVVVLKRRGAAAGRRPSTPASRAGAEGPVGAGDPPDR